MKRTRKKHNAGFKAKVALSGSPASPATIIPNPSSISTSYGRPRRWRNCSR